MKKVLAYGPIRGLRGRDLGGTSLPPSPPVSTQCQPLQCFNFQQPLL